MSAFSTGDPCSVQPKKGDSVVGCGHGDFRQHFFKPRDGPVEIVSPDGSESKADWFMCCDPCFLKANGDISKIELSGQFVWGDAQSSIVIRTPIPECS